jgi:subtilisin family serine protease
MKKIVAILMAMIMVISVTVVLAGSAADKDTKTKEPVIIGFKSTPGHADKAMVRGHGGDIKYSYTIINAIAAKLPEQAIENIQKSPRVTYVEMDGEVHTLDLELDNSWGVKRIGAGTVHAGGNKGAGVNVAIIDTGIDYTHSDLDANYKDGYDYVNNDADPMDDNGHGTHCAGIVAAEYNDAGVVGVAPGADLYAVKVLNSVGSGYGSDVIAGIQWSVKNGMQVISMSLGGSTYSRSLHRACDRAYNKGIVIVAAAGNDGVTVSYPARYDSVIAVAATDSSDYRASFSNTGPAVELAAPGVSVSSTKLGGGYVAKSGTSMACPHVAGTAALVIFAGEGDVRQCLQQTADDLGAAGKDDQYGYGLVDAEEAALGDITPPAQVTGLIVTTVSSIQLDLNWNANTETDLDYYNVYGSMTSGGPYDLIASSTTNSYSDTGLAPLTTYYYTVSAVDSSDNEGTASDKAEGTTSEAGGDVMDVSIIDMWYTTGGPNYFIYTKVTIVDNNRVSVPEATVYLETTLQGGSTVSDSGSTNGEGAVTFKLRSKQTGTYTSTVTNVEKSGWTYDPTGETSKTLPVP